LVQRFQRRRFKCDLLSKYHSAVALLLKAALIQVSDYRLLGASGFYLQPERIDTLVNYFHHLMTEM
jgi:hypothetical protein